VVQVQAEIRSIEDIAQEIYRLRLRAPEITEGGVHPGQFVHIRVPGDSQRLLRRPISVMAARPGIGAIDLVVQQAGEGTRRLRSAHVGETLDVLGPIGRGFDAGQARRVFFVGGGVGVAPIRFAMEAFAADRQCTAFFGFRSAAHAYGLADAPCEVRAATDDGSLGAHALITDLLKAAIEAEPPDLILACGPAQMLRTLQNMALRERIACQLSLEEYMACGIGACLVCSCKMRVRSGTEYRRVCVDGPVFDAREVCFDGC
jgi:dihydroorotate dehydrogenase electron transfer subunit